MANAEDICGTEINGYNVVKPIGQGKFSIVFKAESVADGKVVALKKVKVREGEDEDCRYSR
jgi:serine/threonine protein kinase